VGVLEGSDFIPSLPCEYQQLYDRAERAALIGCLPNSFQFIIGKDALLFRTRKLRKTKGRIVGTVAALNAPVEENL
jgi:hypothetical protein